MKLTISRKLFLSYLAMALLTILASAYAVYRLQSLERLAYAIINQDAVLLENSKKLMDVLIAQESAEKKFIILKDTSFQDLFRTRSNEFAGILHGLSTPPFPRGKSTLSRLKRLHLDYREAFFKEINLIQENRREEAGALSNGDIKRITEDMASYILIIQKEAQESIKEQMNLMRTQVIRASHATFFLSALSLTVGMILVFIITLSISRPLKKLEKATGLIADGRYDGSLNIKREDEIGALAQAFDSMTERLKILEALHLDASPLTGLPGNLAIEKEIERRLSKGKSFSICHVDLDNFKPFADHYGYAWGSEVIKEVAKVLVTKMKTTGHHKADFVGHIGGDDFIIIADAHRAEALCQQIVEDFDRHILKFYTEKDRKSGFIMGKDRGGMPQQFPLITVTIAMVTDDGTRFKSPLEMAKSAAALKEYAKALPGNNYVKQEDLERPL
jgi:diguanylate cyclase (GGDEF)-like protein